MINPLAIKNALDVKKWIEKNPINVLKKYVGVEKAEDDSGFIAIFQFKFLTEEEAQKFIDMYKLAEEFGL